MAREIQAPGPVFNASRIKSSVRGAEAQQQLALTQYQQAIRTGFREVSDALVEYRKVKEIRAQQESLVTTCRTGRGWLTCGTGVE